METKKLSKGISPWILILITVMMLFLTSCGSQMTNNNEQAKNSSIRCTLKDGVLTIKGKGEINEDILNEYPNYKSDARIVIIRDGITGIGTSAFSHCESLTEITIPDSVTNIGQDAFSFCHNLTEITVPGSVTNIGKNAFFECRNLNRVTIPNSVTNIGEGAFELCSHLAEVTIPDGITNIDDLTFAMCYSLKAVYLPKSVTRIGVNAFVDCHNLTVYYSGTFEEWKTNVEINDGFGFPLTVVPSGSSNAETPIYDLYQDGVTPNWDEEIPSDGELTFYVTVVNNENSQEKYKRTYKLHTTGDKDVGTALADINQITYGNVTNRGPLIISVLGTEPATENYYWKFYNKGIPDYEWSTIVENEEHYIFTLFKER